MPCVPPTILVGSARALLVTRHSAADTARVANAASNLFGPCAPSMTMATSSLATVQGIAWCCVVMSVLRGARREDVERLRHAAVWTPCTPLGIGNIAASTRAVTLHPTPQNPFASVFANVNLETEAGSDRLRVTSTLVDVTHELVHALCGIHGHGDAFQFIAEHAHEAAMKMLLTFRAEPYPFPGQTTIFDRKNSPVTEDVADTEALWTVASATSRA